jgi:hypothetical protein
LAQVVRHEVGTPHDWKLWFNGHFCSQQQPLADRFSANPFLQTDRAGHDWNWYGHKDVTVVCAAALHVTEKGKKSLKFKISGSTTLTDRSQNDKVFKELHRVCFPWLFNVNWSFTGREQTFIGSAPPEE